MSQQTETSARKHCEENSQGENFVDWHARFGHADVRAILRLFQGGMATTANRRNAIAALKAAADSSTHCEACLRGKQPPAALTDSADGATRATRPLALVHIDLCGPFPTASRGGARYLCVIVDDYTRLVWARAINTKDAALDAFQYYRTHAETFHSAAGTSFRSCAATMAASLLAGGLRLTLNKPVSAGS